MRDNAVAEMFGYAIMAGTTIIAIVCLASGAGNLITSTMEKAELSGAAMSMGVLANTACSAVRDNNTYSSSCELSIPHGYRLCILDNKDDFRDVNIYCGGERHFSARIGSVRISSPFRSAVFEAGATFTNDSGILRIIRKPPFYTVQDGSNLSLYLGMIGLESNTWASAGGSSVVLGISAGTKKIESWEVPPGKATTVSISTGNPAVWIGIFRDMGFEVSQSGNTVNATSGGVSNVYVSYSMVQVSRGQ